MAEEFTDAFLNDVEKDVLGTFMANQTLVNAVKKVLLADVYFKGTLREGVAPDPTRNAALSLAITKTDLSNEVLGADIRALAEAVRLVESGFNRLANFKPATPDKPKKGGNPAR